MRRWRYPLSGLAAALGLTTLLGVAGCGGGPFSGGDSGPGRPPTGRHLVGRSDGVEFRYDIGDLTVSLGSASDSVRHEIRSSRITARCGQLQASEIWPAHARKLSFGLRPKPAPGNSIPTDPKSPGRFDKCQLIPIPGVDPIVSASMHPQPRPER